MFHTNAWPFRRPLVLLMALVLTVSLTLVSGFGQDVHAAGNPPSVSHQKPPMAKPPTLNVGATTGSPATHPCNPHIKCVYAPPPPGGSTPIYDTDPIVFVHGLQTLSSNTNCSGPGGVWTNELSYLQSNGQAVWHPGLSGHVIAQTGPLYTVGYYYNDSYCSTQLSTTNGDLGAGACNNMVPEGASSGFSNSDSRVGTTNEPIEHIACELSWYVYNGFSANGVNIRIVAHSMGGLIVRYMIQKSGHDSHFAPYVEVSDVVTYSTPHGGLDYNQTSVEVYKCVCSQTLEMEYDPVDVETPFMTAIVSNTHPYAVNGTDWTMLGSLSIWDPLDWDYQATAMSNSNGAQNNHRIGYSDAPACPGQTGWTGGYGHGDYMNDQCDTFDASYYYCDGCLETQHSNFNFAYKSAPHSLLETLFAFTYYDW